MKRHVLRWGSAIGLIMGMSLFAGCVMGGETPKLKTSKAPLYVLTTNVWPTATIPVCWENPTLGNLFNRIKVRNAVEGSWEAVSAVDFTGWGTCTSTSQGLRVQIIDSGPKTRGLGTELDGKPNGVQLNFTFNNWGTATCQGNEDVCIRAHAIHEFGHALGFSHEHNRPDTPTTCTSTHQGTYGNETVGSWDLNSVMNYCNPTINSLSLSAGDIEGVRQIYGRFVYGDSTPPITVQTSNKAYFNYRGYSTHPNSGWSSYKAYTGDVNGDGRADMIWNSLGTYNYVYVGLANGNGGYTYLSRQQMPNTGWSSYKTLVGDINGDGRADLIWSSLGTYNRTYIALGNANGTFSLPTTYQQMPNTGWSSYKAFIADVSGDGRMDIIWNSLATVNRTYVARGNSSGALTLPSSYTTASNQGWSAYQAFVADVNGDNRADMIFSEVSSSRNRVYVALATTPTTFVFTGVETLSTSNWSGYKVIPGDFNGDGQTDLLFNNTSSSNRVYVAFANYAGSDKNYSLHTFQDLPYTGWSGYKTLVGDINGDGAADIVWNKTDSSNRVYVGLSQKNGRFTFVLKQDMPYSGWSNYNTFLADVNGNGTLDLLWNGLTSINRTYTATSIPD